MTSERSFHRIDQTVILALAVPMQLFFMLFPLLVECDATMFLAYARVIAGDPTGVLTPNRPPGFPAFLALTGVLPDTLWPAMVLHAVMGVLIPWLIYRTLAPFNRWVALGAALVNIWSTLPFSASKQLLADQLFVFLLVATIYAMSRLYWTHRPRYVYAAVLCGFATWLTRWEGLLVLVFAILLALLARKPIRTNLRPLLVAVLVGLLVAGGWSVARSRILDDPRLIGSISNGNGLQLMHKSYIFLPGHVIDWEQLLGVRSPSDKTDLITHFFPHDGPAWGVKVIKPDNGPASARLRSLIEEVVADPKSYSSLKAPLDSAYQDPAKPRVDYYFQTFSRFEGNPSALADNFFAQPNPFLLDWLWGQLIQRDGLSETDSLFRNVALEGLVSRPTALVIFAGDILNFFGVDLRGFVSGGPKTLPLLTRANYHATPFNIANCAQTHLSARMWGEYVMDRDFTTKADVDFLFAWGDFYGRNIVRFVLAFLFLATAWVLPWSRHRIFFLPMPVIMFGMMAATALGVGGGAYTRYENPTHHVMLIAVAGSVIAVIARFRSRQAISSSDPAVGSQQA